MGLFALAVTVTALAYYTVIAGRFPPPPAVPA